MWPLCVEPSVADVSVNVSSCMHGSAASRSCRLQCLEPSFQSNSPCTTPQAACFACLGCVSLGHQPISRYLAASFSQPHRILDSVDMLNDKHCSLARPTTAFGLLVRTHRRCKNNRLRSSWVSCIGMVLAQQKPRDHIENSLFLAFTTDLLTEDATGLTVQRGESK